jgi:peptide chain release factor 2/peptide chain release factor
MSAFDLLVTSGTGPVEARWFVSRLAARLEQLAEQRGLLVHEVVVHGDDDAPRSVMLRLAGDGPGALADQLGTHVLVHKSLRRGRASRTRWFAAVARHERPAGAPAVDAASIPREAIVVTACRAGGPGGQHVNKVSSAVRVEHPESGLVVRSASSRSQKANLERALRRLADLLRERADARRAEADAARRGAHYRLERGRPICSYRLDDDGDLVDTGA